MALLVENNYIKVRKGDTLPIEIVVDRDLTGASIYLTVKANLEDADVDAIVQKEQDVHVAPLSGNSIISLSPSETSIDVGTYFCDLRVKYSNGDIETLFPSDEDNTGYLEITNITKMTL